jgi:hypothetical protein
MGSAGAARLVAHMAFFCLLLIGWFSGELSRRATTVMVGLWVAGYVAATLFTPLDLLMTSYVAILDIVLVLLIFKGDVQLH